MKSLIKTSVKKGFFVVVIALCSCSSDGETNDAATKDKNVSIAKKWVLTDKIHDKDKTSKVVLSLETNGYFMIYDSITDKKMIEAGIGRILPISKGQWKNEGKKLVLTHMSVDTISDEAFTIQKMEEKKLILLGQNNKKHTYIVN